MVLRVVDPDYLHKLYAEESSNVHSETYGWRPQAGHIGVGRA